MELITHKFAHKINESKHMTYTIAHIVDGFGHSANIFGRNMNEYRHMTYRIDFCPWNNFTDGTPYMAKRCQNSFCSHLFVCFVCLFV